MIDRKKTDGADQIIENHSDSEVDEISRDEVTKLFAPLLVRISALPIPS